MLSDTVGKSDMHPQKLTRSDDSFVRYRVSSCYVGNGVVSVFRRGIIKGEGGALSLKRAFWPAKVSVELCSTKDAGSCPANARGTSPLLRFSEK